jgi:PASTA domain
MVSRLRVLPRFVIVLAACVLATGVATVAFAATQQPGVAPVAPPAQPAAKPAALVVPDVSGQVYVFAKGALEDAGFAWRVVGAVKGYAANTVASQSPAPGTRLVDTGAPTISLTLARNGRYGEKGNPDDVSPFKGTPVRPADLAVVRTPAPKKARPAAAAKPKAKPAAAHKDSRKPAFAVAGAPKEPLDEITLDARARALDSWVAKHPAPTTANVNHWLYQHAWIVTGAGFGWSHGAQALRILVGVDRKVDARWGVGSRSRDVAKRALAEVEARTQ